jgi:hypothetical protein
MSGGVAARGSEFGILHKQRFKEWTLFKAKAEMAATQLTLLNKIVMEHSTT